MIIPFLHWISILWRVWGINILQYNHVPGWWWGCCCLWELSTLAAGRQINMMWKEGILCIFIWISRKLIAYPITMPFFKLSTRAGGDRWICVCDLVVAAFVAFIWWYETIDAPLIPLDFGTKLIVNSSNLPFNGRWIFASDILIKFLITLFAPQYI